MDQPQPQPLARIGFHYYPDTLHYRSQDLQIWVPELQRMGARWLTLLAPVGRFVPEAFLSGLLQANIQPILHFPLRLQAALPLDDWRMMLSFYQRWGVQQIALFDRPNLRAAWQATNWVQTDLVERFLDVFLPLAQAACEVGIQPLFPPLEPGGDYWDLSFLYSALTALRRRAGEDFFDHLALSAYAWVGDRPLDWGAGGPARWPGARPYLTPEGVQDQRGFYIFDWYLEVCRQAVGRTLPIYLLRAGSCLQAQPDPERAALAARQHAAQNLALAQALSGQGGADLPAIAEEVVACCFWLLAAEKDSPHAAQAWFQPQAEAGPSDRPLPAVLALRRLAVSRTQVSPQAAELTTNPVELLDVSAPQEAEDASPVATVGQATSEAGEGVEALSGDSEGSAPTVEEVAAEPAQSSLEQEAQAVAGDEEEARRQSIQHYVLLPLYGWGVAEWDLNLIEPLLRSSHPTIGFSLAEARLAKRVTVVGGEQVFSDEALQVLRRAGCQVERILEDGTVIAT